MKARACKVKRHRKRRILFIVLACFFIVVIAFTIFIYKNVNPIILTISTQKIRAISNELISDTVMEVMSEDPTKDYLKITRDDKKKITAVEVNAPAVTSMAEKITVLSQKKINAVGSEGIKIPIGSLSGITVFAGMGPDINVRVYLVGTTKTRVISEFTESGINQTLHRLYIDIKSSVVVAIPGIPSTIDTTTRVLMGETVILGEVPPTYLNSTSVGDMLDLAA